MITLKDFFEVTGYRVTEGSDYGWNCFGTVAYSLSAWNGDHDGWSAEVLFSTRTQEVFQMNFCDYSRQRAYRWTNPEYSDAYKKEVAERDIDDMAWDSVAYHDVEVESDILEKTRACFQGLDYDTKVTLEVDFPDDVLFQAMKDAHKRDITFNQWVELALQTAIDEHEANKQEQLASSER